RGILLLTEHHGIDLNHLHFARSGQLALVEDLGAEVTGVAIKISACIENQPCEHKQQEQWHHAVMRMRVGRTASRIDMSGNLTLIGGRSLFQTRIVRGIGALSLAPSLLSSAS